MMEFAMLYTAVRRIHCSSVSRSSLTFFRYGSSFPPFSPRRSSFRAELLPR